MAWREEFMKCGENIEDRTPNGERRTSNIEHGIAKAAKDNNAQRSTPNAQRPTRRNAKSKSKTPNAERRTPTEFGIANEKKRNP
jgi:hypothetical protein